MQNPNRLSLESAGPLPAAVVRAFTERSDAKGLRRLLAHLGLATLTGAAVAYTGGTPVLPLALWLHGVVLVFLFAPLHETLHATAFRSRWLNRAVAEGIGFLLLLPPRYFRVFHLTHHRYTQDPQRDPELSGAAIDTWAGYLKHISGWPLWRERVTTLFRHAAGRVTEPYVGARARGAIITEARVYFAGYSTILTASLALGVGWALWYWLVPLLLGQPLLRLYLLAEHTGCRQVPDMLQNSRTTHTNAAVRFLAWNMPYHAEHHRYAAVPFHALPALHALLKDRIPFQSPGYRHVTRQLAPR